MLSHQKKRSDTTDLPLFSTPADTSRSSGGGHISSFSTASSLSRQPLPGRGYASSLAHNHHRDCDSPPASAYFQGFTGTEEPTASEDASAHFAYSTTLRRHNTLDLGLGHLGHSSGGGSAAAKLSSLGRIVSNEGAEFFGRVISGVSGRQSMEAYRTEEGVGLMNGNGDATAANGFAEKGSEETPSSIFAHSSIEVRFSGLFRNGLYKLRLSFILGHGEPLRNLHHHWSFFQHNPSASLNTWLQRVQRPSPRTRPDQVRKEHL